MGGNGQPSNGSTIIPCLRYRDAQAAIDWLQRAFGFHAQAVYADGDTVFHAQLTFGTGMIMLGSASNQSAWSEHAALPDEVGGRQTQSACVIVTDADAHYARAKAAGARVVIDIADQTTAAVAMPAPTRKAICGGSAATTRGARTTASDRDRPAGGDPLRHRWLGVSRMARRRFLPRGPAAA